MWRDAPVGALRQAKNCKQLNNTMRVDQSKGMSLSLLSVSVSHSLTQSLSLSVRFSLSNSLSLSLSQTIPLFLSHVLFLAQCLPLASPSCHTTHTHPSTDT